MRIKIHKALIYSSLFLTFLGVSCADELSVSETVNISDEFKIDLFQSLTEPSSRIILELATLEEYDCTNYDIESNMTLNDNIINIQLSNILPPEVCTTGQGPAQTQLDFDLGTFENQKIRFFFNDEIYDEAILSDLGSTIEFELVSNYGIKSYISKLNKIPSKSLTCIFQYDFESLESNIDLEISTLDSLVTRTVLEDGYYGHFIVENNEINPKSNEYANSKGFYFDLTNISVNEQDALTKILDNLKQSLSPEIQFEYFHSF